MGDSVGGVEEWGRAGGVGGGGCSEIGWTGKCMQESNYAIRDQSGVRLG